MNQMIQSEKIHLDEYDDESEEQCISKRLNHLEEAPFFMIDFCNVSFPLIIFS
jgi:hypothetical protein